jgi:hypothetical protein
VIIPELPALPGPHFGRRALSRADVLMGGKIVYILYTCSLYSGGGYFFSLVSRFTRFKELRGFKYIKNQMSIRFA